MTNKQESKACSMSAGADDLLGISKSELRGILIMLEDCIRAGVPGAVIELGCAQGITTTYLRKWLNVLDPARELHVVDSFEGLPAKRAEDGDDPYFVRGSFAMGAEVLINNFRTRGLQLPIIHKGWFGRVTDYPDLIAFAFLDGDFYDSIVDGLNAVWPRLSPGGVVAIHDYRHNGLPGVAKACLEVFGKEPDSSFGIEHYTKP